MAKIRPSSLQPPPGVTHPSAVAAWVAQQRGDMGGGFNIGYEPSRAVDPTSDPEVDEFSALEGPPDRSHTDVRVRALRGEFDEPTKSAEPVSVPESRPTPAVHRHPELRAVAFGGGQARADFASEVFDLRASEVKALRAILIRAYKRHQREVIAQLESND